MEKAVVYLQHQIRKELADQWGIDSMPKKFYLSSQHRIICITRSYPIALLIDVRVSEVSYDTKAYGFAQLPSDV